MIQGLKSVLVIQLEFVITKTKWLKRHNIKGAHTVIADLFQYEDCFYYFSTFLQ